MFFFFLRISGFKGATKGEWVGAEGRGGPGMNCEQPHDDPKAYLTKAVWLKPRH